MFDTPAVRPDVVSRQHRWLAIICSTLGHGLVAGVGIVILAPSAVWSFVEPPCSEIVATRLTFRWPLPPAPSQLLPSVTARHAAVVAAVPMWIDEGDVALATADDEGDDVASSMITPAVGGVCGCTFGGLSPGVTGGSIGPIMPVPSLVLPA